MRGIAISQCGGTPERIDGTSDRYAQDVFPDLALIRDRGFAERSDAAKTVRSDCELIPASIPAYKGWLNTIFHWQDLARQVRGTSGPVRKLAASTSECLRRRSGLAVPMSDPTAFLHAVDIAMVKGATRKDYARWGRDFADCSKGYFEALASALKPERQRAIKDNEFALRELTNEILKAGYVPLENRRREPGTG